MENKSSRKLKNSVDTFSHTGICDNLLFLNWNKIYITDFIKSSYTGYFGFNTELRRELRKYYVLFVSLN